MNIFSQAVRLWKKEKSNKGSSLNRTLLIFFSGIPIVIILILAFCLSWFGMTDGGRNTLSAYIDGELAGLSENISDDFAELSVTGISLSQKISDKCDTFFHENGITADKLAEHPELFEAMLGGAMEQVLFVADHYNCGGVFIMLDAATNASADSSARAGVFIKKTSPVSSQAANMKNYMLRGSAAIARAHNIELLGQWEMEFDISGQEFFTEAMETARRNPELPLSRLYRWTGRVLLKGNSEAGFLLLVPLRSYDGTVFGLCGIEVSDRMFKYLYSPGTSDYTDVFSVLAPYSDNLLHTESGLVAGNHYLTGFWPEEHLTVSEGKADFYTLKNDSGCHSGRIEKIVLYPADSPYSTEEWRLAVLMPEADLNEAISGSTAYYIAIFAVMLILCIAAVAVASRRISKAVKKNAQRAMRRDSDGGIQKSVYTEFDDLMVYLEELDSAHEKELRTVNRQKELVQLELSRIAEQSMDETDPDDYEHFLANLSTLTEKEREIFDLYLENLPGKEIRVMLGIKENTFKFHNKNIYQKLGVSSRKELMRYATLMRHGERKEKK